MFFILISFFKVDFTAWSNSNAVENHVVVKTICGLVVTHIGFAYIRPLKRVLAHFTLFLHGLTFFRLVSPVGLIFDRGRDSSG